MLQTRLGSLQSTQNAKLSQAKADLEKLQATVLQKNTLSEKLFFVIVMIQKRVIFGNTLN